MAIRRPDDSSDPDVQLTSFMDCAFLLLIFFIVTASLKKPHKELNIVLPNAGHAKLAKTEAEVIVSITDKGERFLFDGRRYQNQQPLGRQELMSYLQNVSLQNASLPKDQHARIYLDIHRDTPYHHIMDVMDTFEFYNLRDLHFRSQHSDFSEHEPPQQAN